MWIITTCGFFSVVKKTKGRILTVRARRIEDLDRLKAKYLPSLVVQNRRASTNTDYPFRGTVAQIDFSCALADMVLDIDYSNFKDAAKAEQGASVGQVYMRVWSELMALEPKGRKGLFMPNNRLGINDEFPEWHGAR